MGQSLKLLIFLQLFSYLVNYISAFNGVNLFYENSSNNLLYRITKIQRLDPLYSLTSISTSIIVLVLLHKHWAIQKFLEKWSCNDFWTDSVFFWVQNCGASWWALCSVRNKKNMVFCGHFREVFAKLHSDNFALLAFYLNVIKTRSQGN